ncbi:phage tail protein [Klebsiella pneumoniae]
MARQYYGILTTKGRALYANALLLNQDVNLSEMAIDDTVNFLPDEKLESLPSEVYRAELNSLEKDEDNDEMVIAELVIPSQSGGFYCRGFGLYTDGGILFAVGSLAETYKATEDEGSGGELVIQADIVVTNTAALVLKVDPTTVLATRETVDRAIAAHEAKLDPHPQYAPKNSPTLTGIPKAPTPAEGNNTTQIATTAFVQAIATALNTALALKAPLASPGLTGTPTAPTAAQSTNNTQIATTAFVKSAIAALVASSPAELDTLNELAAALGNDPNFATTMTNALAGKQPLDSTLTNLSGKDVAGLLSYLGLGDASGYVGRLLNVQVFYNSGIYTATTGTKKVIVEMVGGGAGSAGSRAAGSGQVAVGGAGGAGSYAKGSFTQNFNGVQVTVGAKGAGGTVSGPYASDGGTSSFGSLISAAGGAAGQPAGPTSSFPFSTVAAVVSAGDNGANIIGTPGQGASASVVVNASVVIESPGGSSQFGAGGFITAFNAKGINGSGFGAGGGPSKVNSGGAAVAGGDGSQGLVIVWEYA